MNSDQSQVPQFTHVSSKAIGALTNNPYNAPHFSDDFSEDEFYAEYWRIHGLVHDAITGLGLRPEDSPDDEWDFSMNESWGNTRFICVDIHRLSVASQNLVNTLWAVLETNQIDYLIALSCEWFDDSEDLFFINITRNQIVGRFEQSVTAKLLGFDGTSEFIKKIED